MVNVAQTSTATAAQNAWATAVLATVLMAAFLSPAAADLLIDVRLMGTRSMGRALALVSLVVGLVLAVTMTALLALQLMGVSGPVLPATCLLSLALAMAAPIPQLSVTAAEV